MRQKRENQLSIWHALPRKKIARELEAISKILDDNPELFEPAYRDLVGVKDAQAGRAGMSAEQTVRAGILKQYRGLTYEELAFLLEDSRSMRAFARLGNGQRPSASTLQENVKAISEQTWREINERLVRHAADTGREKGRTVRIDSTAVETDIHYPTDSRLIEDCVRCITRLLVAGKELSRTPAYRFADHRRVVRNRVIKIRNCRKKEKRKSLYQDLLRIAERVRGFAIDAAAELADYASDDLMETIRAQGYAAELERLAGLLTRIMDQTRRRVIEEEKVPASDKLVSIFECHTDIIEKGRRETVFGHKVFVVGGQSGMILDCLIERGNPTDASQLIPLLDRQKELFNRAPRQAAADGGFASAANLEASKRRGVKDMCFAKRKGLSVRDMAKSPWVYKKLRNFRAGVEAGISTLKRAFGLRRCNWSDWEGFKQYVHSAIVSYNLLVLARHELAQIET